MNIETNMNTNTTSTPPNTPMSAIPPNVLNEMGGNTVARRDSVVSNQSNGTDGSQFDDKGRRRSLRVVNKQSLANLKKAAEEAEAKARKEEQEREAKEREADVEMEVEQKEEVKKVVKKDKGKKKVVVKVCLPSFFHSISMNAS